MIYLTTAANDKDLLKPLGDLAVTAPIPYGDFIFTGVTEVDGQTQPVKVCGERKKMGDMVNCIDDGRHVAQMQAANEAGFDYYFLVLESVWRTDKGGQVQYRRGRNWVPTGMHRTRLEAYLNQLHYLLGVQVKQSANVKETAAVIKGVYQFFQTTEHSSLKKFYTSPVSGLLLKPPSLVRRVAKELPGIGWERSLLVEETFDSVRTMVNAPLEEWLEIEGIGKGIATKVQEELA